uniref:PPIase cyclophilin-type domain-containing protein n=1 Tax=Steinernema glaseri TaxID=37863 RepID=A0A1I8A2H3_9BILA
MDPRVYFHLVTEKGDDLGRVVFTLSSRTHPYLSENFRLLCTGERSCEMGVDLHYKKTHFHAICPKQGIIVGGDIVNRNGSGGHAATDVSFTARNPSLPIKAGTLCMLNQSPKSTRFDSQFFIIVDDIDYCEDGVAFGTVTEGLDVLKQEKPIVRLDPSWPEKIWTSKDPRIVALITGLRPKDKNQKAAAGPVSCQWNRTLRANSGRPDRSSGRSKRGYKERRADGSSTFDRLRVDASRNVSDDEVKKPRGPSISSEFRSSLAVLLATLCAASQAQVMLKAPPVAVPMTRPILPWLGRYYAEAGKPIRPVIEGENPPRGPTPPQDAHFAQAGPGAPPLGQAPSQQGAPRPQGPSGYASPTQQYGPLQGLPAQEHPGYGVPQQPTPAQYPGYGNASPHVGPVPGYGPPSPAAPQQIRGPGPAVPPPQQHQGMASPPGYSTPPGVAPQPGYGTPPGGRSEASPPQGPVYTSNEPIQGAIYNPPRLPLMAPTLRPAPELLPPPLMAPAFAPPPSPGMVAPAPVIVEEVEEIVPEVPVPAVAPPPPPPALPVLRPATAPVYAAPMPPPVVVAPLPMAIRGNPVFAGPRIAQVLAPGLVPGVPRAPVVPAVYNPLTGVTTLIGSNKAKKSN